MLLVGLTILTVAILAAVLAGPFRRPPEPAQPPRRGDREEAKLAKYRELRDLELDWRTGKLAEVDYQRTKNLLRAQAAQLLEESGAPAASAEPESESTTLCGPDRHDTGVSEASAR